MKAVEYKPCSDEVRESTRSQQPSCHQLRCGQRLPQPLRRMRVELIDLYDPRVRGLGHDDVSSCSMSSRTSLNAVSRSRQYRSWGLSHAETSCSGSGLTR